MSKDDLKAFGTAVRRARTLQGWTLDQLGDQLDPQVGKSFVSKVERGQRDTLNPRTVGRFIKALGLDEAWIDRFLDIEDSEEGDETPTEREADKLIRMAAKDESLPKSSEDLLILLANKHAEGRYTDRITAYVGLSKALEAAERIRQRGEMPVGNADLQFNATMKEVAALNAEGEVDAADALLDAEEKRMFAAHKAEQDRMAQQAQTLLDRRLDQDRLRNDPAAAADRLIMHLRRASPPEGVFQATRNSRREWVDRGKLQGDPFDLRVALVLANRNYQRAKGTLRQFALLDLGTSRGVLGERSASDDLLEGARQALEAAIKGSSKQDNPSHWGGCQHAFGSLLVVIGERWGNKGHLLAAIDAFKAALLVADKSSNADGWATSHNSLGTAQQALGEIDSDEERLQKAVAAFEAALTVWSPDTAPDDWAMVHNNLGITRRWLGAIASDTSEFDLAGTAFARCLSIWTEEGASFNWAKVQWNLGDLAMARFALDPDPALLDGAEANVRAAREVFFDGSDYHTERCEDLLRRISEARAGLGPK